MRKSFPSISKTFCRTFFVFQCGMLAANALLAMDPPVRNKSTWHESCSPITPVQRNQILKKEMACLSTEKIADTIQEFKNDNLVRLALNFSDYKDFSLLLDFINCLEECLHIKQLRIFKLRPDSSYEGSKVLNELIKKFPSLQQLDMDCSDLTHIEFLDHTPQLIALSLRYNNFENVNFSSLKKLTNLKILNLSHNNLSKAMPLIDQLVEIPNLVTLDLYFNNFGDKGAKEFANALFRFKTLRNFHFGPDKADRISSETILEFVRKNLHLSQLGLGKNKLDVDGCLALENILKERNKDISGSPPLEILVEDNVIDYKTIDLMGSRCGALGIYL